MTLINVIVYINQFVDTLYEMVGTLYINTTAVVNQPLQHHTMNINHEIIGHSCNPYYYHWLHTIVSFLNVFVNYIVQFFKLF